MKVAVSIPDAVFEAAEELAARRRISTVLAAAVTSNLRLADAPGNVELAADESGLDRDSVVNVSQIVTIDKSALSDWAGRVDAATMRRIEAGLALALDLPATF